jgi:hypothetical protein
MKAKMLQEGGCNWHELYIRHIPNAYVGGYNFKYPPKAHTAFNSTRTEGTIYICPDYFTLNLLLLLGKDSTCSYFRAPLNITQIITFKAIV